MLLAKPVHHCDGSHQMKPKLRQRDYTSPNSIAQYYTTMSTSVPKHYTDWKSKGKFKKTAKLYLFRSQVQDSLHREREGTEKDTAGLFTSIALACTSTR